MWVELDILSGQPNPAWELSESDSLMLRRLEARLEICRLESPVPPGLGYRGFSYEGAGGRCRAYGGFVQMGQALLMDRDRTIERFLAGTLPKQFWPLRAKIDPQGES
jgi:hypothetical protein